MPARKGSYKKRVARLQKGRLAWLAKRKEKSCGGVKRKSDEISTVESDSRNEFPADFHDLPPIPPSLLPDVSSSANLTGVCHNSIASSSGTSQSSDNVTDPSLIGTKLMEGIIEDKKYNKKYIISQSQVDTLASSVLCSIRNCRGKVVFDVSTNKWDSDFTIRCLKCLNMTYAPADRVKDHGTNKFHAFSELNVEETYHSLVAGIGSSGLGKLSETFGKTAISQASYGRHCSYLFERMNTYYDKYMKKAHEALRNYYIEKEMAEPDENGVIDIEVSFDGTWLNEGRKSHVGIGFIIEVNTGTVIDMILVSNQCYLCDAKKEKEHKWCNKNFDGLSSAIEPEEARRMWSRSIDRGFRYVVLVGDSKAHTAVCEMNNGYGPYDIPIRKSERKCHKSIQKSKESIHKGLWSKCPKSKYFGIRRVKFCAQVTILEHNFGDGKVNLLAELFEKKESGEASLDTKKEKRKPSTKRPRRKAKKNLQYNEDGDSDYEF